MKQLLIVGFFLFGLSQNSISQPNIILIVADDMGYSDLSCFGSEIPTPNLDKLAYDGIRMRQFYNSAKCEPSRAMIITGQHWHQVGLDASQGTSIAEVLQGPYSTFAVGKWHLKGNPLDRGFDRFFGHLNGATDYFNGDPSFRLDRKPYQVPDNFYATSAYADYSIQFIDESVSQNPKKPFFLYLAHTAPHAPLMALPEDEKLFTDTYKEGWDYIRKQRIELQQKLGISDPSWPIPERPKEIPAWNSLTPKEQQTEAKRMAIYAAMIHRMDISIGRVIDHLEKLGIRENTLIVFISDNGANPFDRGRIEATSSFGPNQNYGLGWAFVSNTPFRYYKKNQHNGGACTGAIINWPQEITAHGKIIDTPAQILDLKPTIIDVAGMRAPSENAPTGQSLKPLFCGSSASNNRTFYFHLDDNAALIENSLKLVKAYGQPWELYDLQKDRNETNDISAQHPEKTEELIKNWKNWADNFRLESGGTNPQYVPLK